ncbi:MAG: site-specific DNA-methyltransferase, partial [Verrucomicrobiae bacterium]|nr:site-specific DNA-methyltransferase [Verrucomicrobiae bacterium]
MPPKKKTAAAKSVETIKHSEEKRKNIPSAEQQSILQKEHEQSRQVRYPRNTDLDPQLVWRGKDEQDWSDLVVHAPPLYIQEKVHPKALIDDLLRQTKERQHDEGMITPDLFADFNGIPKGADKTEFYAHDQNWSNRMILGDSLQVMASLAEREGLRGKVQCIYFDPPYGIKFNSNFQWSTTSRDVKDGKVDHITREPEQVKAFRDTWRDGIHSYLTYLRDRLTVARDLLTDSGSIFVQIGDENVHRVRAVMDEVFGDQNSCGFIAFKKTSGAGSFAGGTDLIAAVYDYILWYSKDISRVKYRQMYYIKDLAGVGGGQYSRVLEPNGRERAITQEEIQGGKICGRVFRGDNLTSQTTRVGQTTVFPVEVSGNTFSPAKGGWKTNRVGMDRLKLADRLYPQGRTLSYRRFFEDFVLFPVVNAWDDTVTSGFGETKNYVVQTNTRVIERCLLMATDPGDLVLDPTCGSGTTATVAEQWGRRWITIDTSRVALALARARIMGARYPYYLLADSREGQLKEAELTRSAPSSQPVHGNIRQGLVYERVPHITLKSIANNTEIDVIWEEFQQMLEPLRDALNKSLSKAWKEWEIPREADANWPEAAKQAHADWWQHRITRQKEIDASIAARADSEYLYDKPYEDKKKVRVAGPFTVESLSPHRVLGVDEDDELVDGTAEDMGAYGAERNFISIILDTLKTAGVQQAHKDDKIDFTALTPWPGELVCAEGRYIEGHTEKRA